MPCNPPFGGPLRWLVFALGGSYPGLPICFHWVPCWQRNRALSQSACIAALLRPLNGELADDVEENACFSATNSGPHRRTTESVTEGRSKGAGALQKHHRSPSIAASLRQRQPRAQL